ncbi:MAG: hypothetical protein WBE44_19680, partial [Terriglobales bacterium]
GSEYFLKPRSSAFLPSSGIDFSVVEPKKKHKVVVPRYSTTLSKFAAKLQGHRQVPSLVSRP